MSDKTSHKSHVERLCIDRKSMQINRLQCAALASFHTSEWSPAASIPRLCRVSHDDADSCRAGFFSCFFRTPRDLLEYQP